MKSLLFGKTPGSPSQSAVNYTALTTGTSAFGAAEANRQMVMPSAGSFNNLRVKFNTAPGVGKNYVITLRVNGVDSAITVTLSDANTTVADTTHSVSVVAGDLVNFTITPTGTPALAVDVSTVIQFTGTTENESVLLSSGGSNTEGTSGTFYTSVGGCAFSISQTTENVVSTIMAVSGNLKNLYVKMTTAPGGATNRVFALMVNGVATSLTCTVTGAATTGSDTSNSVAVVAGDQVSIRDITSGSAATAGLTIGVTLVATTNGLFQAGSVYAVDSVSATNYMVTGNANNLSIGTTELVTNQVYSSQMTVVAMYGKNITAPTAGKSRAYTFRDGASSSNITFSIADANTTGNDTAHTKEVADGDLIDFMTVPTATPAGTVVKIAFAAQTNPYPFVNDTVTVSENLQIRVSLPLMSESVTVSENLQMRIIYPALFMEPGGDADFLTGTTNGFWSAVGGTTAVGTDFVHGSHIKSINYANGTVTSPAATVADAGARISAYFYIHAYPSATATIMSVVTSASAGVVRVRITTAGVLSLTDASNVQLGSNGATLALNTWYRLCLSYTVTSTTINRFELFKDSVSTISVTNGTISNTVSNKVVFGNGNANATLDMRSSDHYIDVSSTLDDTGDVWVTAKRPNANGTLNNFSTQIGAGGSGYGTGHSPQVNERPLSLTNGWSMVGAGSAVTEEYSIEGQSTGDIDTTTGGVINYMGWVSAKALAGETAQIIVKNVATNITLTTSATVFMKVQNSQVYPAGSTDIGLITATTLTTVSLYECGVIVAFIPTPGASLSVSVVDNVTVSEATQISYSLPSPIVDSVTITENIALTVFAFPSVSDNVTITENITIRVNALFSVFDSVTVSENVAMGANILPTVFDNVTITENISIKITVSVSPFDSVTITENISVKINVNPSVFDSVTVSENLQIFESIPLVFESITVTESITVFIPTLFISVFDTVTITENLKFQGVDYDIDFETVTVSESITIKVNSSISVSDTVTVSEFIRLQTIFNITLFDSVTVSEWWEVERVRRVTMLITTPRGYTFNSQGLHGEGTIIGPY